MDVGYINPFIEGVQHLFSTMFGCEVKRGQIGFAPGGGKPREITALIGLSGLACGTVAMSFPVATALALVGKLLGTETRVVDETVSDGIAELVNIVAGHAKAKFPQAETYPVDLSLPTVIRGNSYTVDYPSQARWLDVPFTSDLGSFSLRVTLKMDKKHEGKGE